MSPKHETELPTTSFERYEGEILRIYMGADDRVEGRSLFDVLLEQAREYELSGGTVFRGVEGYGTHGEIHTAQILRLSEQLPMVAEFVGRRAKIERFLIAVEPLLQEGLITRTPTHITKIRET